MTNTKVELSSWRKPGTDEVRLYVQNIHEIIGLDIERYNTGNISSASLGGETISNSKAYEIVDVKVFLIQGEDGDPAKVGDQVRVYVQNLGNRSPLSSGQIAGMVRAVLAAEVSE